MAKLKNFCLDLLFPITCLSCQKAGDWLCHSCLTSFPVNKQLICPGCSQPSFQGRVHAECKNNSPLNGLVAVANWQYPPLKEIVHALKFHYAKDTALPIAKILGRKISAVPFFEKILIAKDSYLIPVPLHKTKLRKRGFNQASLIADELAVLYNINLLNDYLQKKKSTKPQTKLKGEQRRKNLVNAFKLSQQLPADAKNIILLDDVMTTGATLNACAQVIKEHEPKIQVWGLVVAKG